MNNVKLVVKQEKPALLKAMSQAKSNEIFLAMVPRKSDLRLFPYESKRLGEEIPTGDIAYPVVIPVFVAKDEYYYIPEKGWDIGL